MPPCPHFLLLQAVLNKVHTFRDKHGVMAENNSKKVHVLDPWGLTEKMYRRAALPLQLGRIQLEIMQGTPLHLATMNGNAVAVENLLRFGSDAEITTGAYASYNDAYFEKSTSTTFKALSSAGLSKMKTALHLVPEIQKGGGHIAEILVKHGAANIEVQDYKGWTPLIGAAVLGNLEVVEALIELGCDMDTMPDINQTKITPQFAFWTALRHAVYNQRHAVIVALMREGADPNCIATNKDKLKSHVESEFDIHACQFLQNIEESKEGQWGLSDGDASSPPGDPNGQQHQQHGSGGGGGDGPLQKAFAAHFKDSNSHTYLKKMYSPDEVGNKAANSAEKTSWLETRTNNRVANLMATMKRLRKKQTTMMPSEMLTDYEKNGPMKLDMDEHVKNLKEIGTAACLPWFLRTSTGDADEIAEALLTSTFDHSKRTREILYSTNILTLSDSFYLAVKCDEPELADLIFKYAWTMRSGSEAKRANSPGGELLEKFKCWKLLLMILKDRVFDRESSFMVRACECRNNDMVTMISALRTLVRSDLAIAASSITKVLNDKLNVLRHKQSGTQRPSLSQQISKYKQTGARYDYRKLKELVDHCEKDEMKGRHWPRALVDVDDNKSYDTMNYGRLQEGLDIIVSCQSLVEEFVFNFEAPPGSLNAFSPLHYTCNAEEEMIESVQTLAKAKVNVNAKGKYGLTPLHISCLRGHVRVVEELLAYNANSAQFTRLDYGCIFPHNGSDIIMNTLKIYREAVERITALQMAVHPRLFFSATVSAVQEETGAQLAQHGDVVESDQTNFKAVAERIVYNLGLGDYIRLAKISDAEAFNLAKHGAYESVKSLTYVDNSSLEMEEKEENASLEKEIEHAYNQQYTWHWWHNSSQTLVEPKVNDKSKVRRLLGLDEYAFLKVGDKLGDDSACGITRGFTTRNLLERYIISGQSPTCDDEKKALKGYIACIQGECLFKELAGKPNPGFHEDHNECKLWSFVKTSDDLTTREAVAKLKPAEEYVKNYVKQHTAAHTGFYEDIQIELKRKAWRKVKMFAMHGAIHAVLQRALKTPKCHLNIVKQLVERGDSKEYTNEAGQNALHLAYLNLKLDEDERAACPDMTHGPHDPEEGEGKDYRKEDIELRQSGYKLPTLGRSYSSAARLHRRRLKDAAGMPQSFLVRPAENDDDTMAEERKDAEKRKTEKAETDDDTDDDTDLKFGLRSGPATEIVRFLQRETNLGDLEEVLDKDLNPPFTKPQREEYYMMVQKDMDKKPDWRNPLYRGRRSQSAVKFKWVKEVWNIKCCTLIMYLVFLFTVLIMALDQFGNLTTPAINMVRGVEEVLVNDEWDSVDGGRNIGGHSGVNGFLDIVNVDEYWLWLENVALGAVFSDPKPYRDTNGTLLMTPRSISPNVYLIGRPRLRQIRVDKSSCLRDAKSGGARDQPEESVVMSEHYAALSNDKLDESDVMIKHYAALSNDTCFNREDRATNNFTAGGKTYVYQDTLGPRTTPFVGSWGKLQPEWVYSGGGYSWNIPTNKTLAMEEFQSMKDGDWIDLNTMAVFFEFGLYNSNYNMFMVGRMTLEMDQMGMITTHHDFKAMRMNFDNYWKGGYRTYLMALYIFFFILYIVEEMRQCCLCCRSRTGVEIEKMRRRGDVDPMNNVNGCCTKTSCFIRCCKCLCTECCRGEDEAKLAAVNASEYFSWGYDTLDVIIYLLHILLMCIQIGAANRTVPFTNQVRLLNGTDNVTGSKSAVMDVSYDLDPMFVHVQQTLDGKDHHQPEDFVAVMFENAFYVDVQKIVVSIVLFCMVVKSAEHFIINDLYAK